MDQETLDILAGLNAAQPTTQQVDYSGFMQDFQPVQNYPNYFVPQQGLLQNTPTLDTLSDLDVMQQRPQNLLNMINQYPTLESDFQRSFAVSPDTFNMEVYKPLPYDADYWNSFATQAGGTTGGDDTLGAVIGGGLLASKLLGGDNDDGGSGTDGSGTDGSGSNSGGIDTGTIITGGSGNDTLTGTGTNTIEINSNTGGGATINTINGAGGDDTIDGGTGTQTTEISSGNNILTTTLTGGAGNDTIDGGDGNETEETSGYITKDNATNIINTLVDIGDITADNAASLINTIETTNANFGSALLSGLSSIAGSSAQASNLINNAETILSGTKTASSGVSGSSFTPTNEGGGLNLDGSIDGQINLSDTGSEFNLQSVGTTPTGATAFETFTKDGQTFYEVFTDADGYIITKFDPASNQMIPVDDPRGMFEKGLGKVSNFMNNPLNEGFGAAGSGLNDATQFTGGELLSLGGGLLSLNAALEEATPTNVFGSAVGIGASGLLGGTAQALATNPLTAPIGMALLFAEGLQADPSNKTGFGGFDLATSSSEDFGMGGDKFKQGNVDKASAISQGMGTAINTIADGFGLKTQGDVLVQTGNRDPLSVTYGNQETEQTADNRLNYNPETGDIINSTDDIQRFYYTGENGFDANMLANDLIQGTTLLSLKAVANGEDTIDISNLSKVSQSPDAYKNSLLAQGYTEQGADTMLNIAQVGGVDTMGLLGNKAIVATNENQYLTETEIASLLEKGYTEEEIAQYT
tara:strand:- start:44 stop:2305 length:2262 start_codon:yes stop_codon:yes gene_type:complete